MYISYICIYTHISVCIDKIPDLGLDVPIYMYIYIYQYWNHYTSIYLKGTIYIYLYIYI